jgi:hypothetical protein
LRNVFNHLPNVEVLRFAWIDGVGPDTSVTDIYQFDMQHVRTGTLMVGVLDHPSFGLGMEIQERCVKQLPLMPFFPRGMLVPRIVTDCIKGHKSAIMLRQRIAWHAQAANLFDPIEYTSDEQIVHIVADWVHARLSTLATA